MQLYQQVERLMLQNHNAGDVVGEGDRRPSWSVTVRSAKAAGEQAGAEQRQAQQ